jgi:hypothetical protein
MHVFMVDGAIDNSLIPRPHFRFSKNLFDVHDGAQTDRLDSRPYPLANKSGYWNSLNL